jgi:hypothetical protein
MNKSVPTEWIFITFEDFSKIRRERLSLINSDRNKGIIYTKTYVHF